MDCGTVVLPVMMISVTCALGGRQATITAAAPMSSGCSIIARRSAGGGSGRLSRISVATSPGQMFVHPAGSVAGGQEANGLARVRLSLVWVCMRALPATARSSRDDRRAEAW